MGLFGFGRKQRGSAAERGPGAGGFSAMIDAYEELSPQNKSALASHWDELPPEDKRKYVAVLGDMLTKKAAACSGDEREQLLDLAETLSQIAVEEEKYCRQIDGMDQAQLQAYIANLYGADSRMSRMSPEDQRKQLKGDYISHNKTAVMSIQSLEK